MSSGMPPAGGEQPAPPKPAKPSKPAKRAPPAVPVLASSSTTPAASAPRSQHQLLLLARQVFAGGSLDRAALRALLELMGGDAVDELDLDICISGMQDEDEDEDEVTSAQFDAWYIQQEVEIDGKLSPLSLVAEPPKRPPRPARRQVDLDFSEAPREMKEKMMLKMWDRVDTDGNGSLDRDEVLDVLLQMGYTKSQIDLDVTMAEIDEDGNGEVDFDEFRNWFFIQDATAQESMVVVYYRASDGSQAETTLAGLPSLFADGTVGEETLIWMDGMDGWDQLGAVRAADASIAESLCAAFGECSTRAGGTGCPRCAVFSSVVLTPPGL